MWLGSIWAKWRRPRPSRPAAAAAPARRAARPVHDSFETALARLAAAPDGGAGRLRVVSLADFREAVGAKWPRLSDKVAMIAEAVIRRHIGTGNVFRRQGEDLWLMAFLNGDSAQARDAANAIARDLSHHLLGESCVHGERPLAVAAHVAAAAILGDDGVLDERRVCRAIEDSRSLLEADGDKAARAVAWRPLPRPEGPCRPRIDWQVLRRDRPQAVPDEAWSGVPPLPPDARLRLLWRPTWVAEGEAISAYCARVLRFDGDGAEPLEGPLAYPADDPASAARLDRFIAAAALDDLRRAHAAGQRPSVIMPLSWSTLARHGAQLLQPFAEIGEAMRRDWVRIEVFRIPDDVSDDELEAVRDLARRLCGEALLRLRLGSPLMERIGELGAVHVGLDLSELRPSERMSDDTLLSALESLHDSAGHAGARCYLWGARRRRVVGGVVRNGFEMVNGPGLMRDVGAPAGVVSAPRRRFLLNPCAPA